MVCDHERDGKLDFLVGAIFNKRGKFKLLGLQGDQSPPLVRHHDLPIRKILMRVVSLLTVMILKRVSEVITYFIEIKEKNSSNIFLITVNENLHLKI